MSDEHRGPDDLFDRRPCLTRREVAARFGRTERTIKNWDKNVPLHPIKIGRSVFYPRKEIERLLGTSSEGGV